MPLENIPDVCIENFGDYAFVQIVGPGGKNYVHGTSKWASHNGVFRFDFLKSLPCQDIDHTVLSQFRCSGGGRILVDPERKTLVAYDRSHDFGDFDGDVVRSLLETYVAENLKGFSVEVV